MATYESLIKIKGAVGDLVFYNLNGKNVVRKKSGFNKKAFKKNASYEKVRQNSSEFGHCSKMGKIIRKSLDFYIKEAGDTLLYQKFAKLMTEIKDLDTISERGKRTVVNGLTTEKGKKLLKNFQMGKIENISAQAEMKDRVLYLNENNGDSQATIICIKLDSVNYTAESTAEKISPLQPEVQFKKQFSEEDFLLYFVVLEKNNEISNMGFV
ncbi:hypothetical protein H3Z85_18380 [Chryseobacterium indologenes]|uniref:Uncharacterized protein n=1 Tax=Chryseobacterium indologenes TaxID=253 RepID=A0A4U8VHB1_CHRID|nr:hypothetical protein [Chryseobacterium indologenes]ASE61063.1 hypothetical protein CEQ15_05890 [Chryseobacterium indologenes]ATN05148.1 hypothetical protein CRN76_06885 [Chryseobacterium indologenes]AZB16722.1 hypothetical protein EG352_02495 [Chryseobacterium indologenes]QIX82999.1 hypothetical protein FOB56_17900 [Chryseobacterium indologenes]QPQ51261.1 hypothetical protein H3Z85_18380 [Chryseobacterium indologenes]